MVKTLRTILAALLLVSGLGLLLQGVVAAQQQPADAAADAYARTAIVMPLAGPIGPATKDHFLRTLERAGEQGAALLIVKLDTPGGLDESMRGMIQAILNAPIPVVVYVAPSGARAASAGTYLLYASHVAAMAPGTNLGAATPVPIGGAPPDAPAGTPSSPEPPGAGDGPKERGGGAPGRSVPVPGSASERKAVNDSAAYIRSLAELRGRNADWAERAVREGVSLSAERAVELGAVDLIAADVAQLLERIDGREVKVGESSVTLATRGLVLREVVPDWRTELLALITNPNLAYLLMLIGIYGLLLEGYNPGAILPGVVGAISLLLALFAFQVLSVNYAGLALIALGVLLIIAESFVPAFGSLGLGGIVAFVIGSIMLLDNDVPGFAIARPLIGAVALLGALLLLAIARYAMRARRRPVVSGAEGLLAETAEALESFAASGRVRVHGEIWNAVSREPVVAGQRLRILRIDGLTLAVEPIRE
jgi:membrane-bound serine protease (ClpP class)